MKSIGKRREHQTYEKIYYLWQILKPLLTIVNNKWPKSIILYTSHSFYHNYYIY